MKFAIEILSEEDCFDGFFQMKRYRLRHSLYRGGMSEVLERERVERLQAAAVLLYDPVRDCVVMIEQFRIGALERGGADCWLLEVVGGLMKPDEDAEEVARREAEEESGCRIKRLVPISRFYVSPGTASEFVYLFCGEVDAGNAGGYHGLAEEGEDIRVCVMDADDLIAGLDDGRVNSTTAIISTQWLALNRVRLRDRWAVSDPV